jgi:hypothetical protein
LLPSTPPALVAALIRDRDVRECATESGKLPQTYALTAFDVRRVLLRGGEAMTVMVATDACLARGQSTRIMIFEKTAVGYRRVLDDLTLPGLAKVESTGTVTLPTHESMDVILESTYVWNGVTYAFSPIQSHRYDVALAQRRPYETPVRFVRGESSAVLSGSVAYNFGDHYVFEASAGQRVTIRLMTYAGSRPAVSLYYKDEISSVAELGATSSWTGKVRKGGLYHLFVTGTSERDATRRSAYSIRLSIGSYSSGGATGAGALREGGWSSDIEQ